MKIVKHFKDLTKIVIAYIISSLMKLNKENKDIWLISERKDEAEDNGYHLYKYIREKHPEKKVFYLINKSSSSFLKLEKYKTIIQYNSLKHYIYYFLSDKHISAFQFFGVPETPFLWKFEELGLIKKKKIFLQHGITQSMLPFLKYDKTKYRLFICGAKTEYEYIKKYYGYPDDNLKYLGFCRFDNLHNHNEKNQILIMPTWRQWLGMTNDDNDKDIDDKKFYESEYYQKYNSLINNKKLEKILIDNKFELIFYPHPEMQRFIGLFNCSCKNILIANRKESNLQELLKESKVIITDYSSIAFDCAYMRKSLIYYQFDYDRYYDEHFKKGYFDASEDGFGPVIKKEDDLIILLEKYMKNTIDRSKYIKRSEEFFPLYDNKNCERNYKAIEFI